MLAHQLRRNIRVRKGATRAAYEVAIHILRVSIDLIQLFPHNAAQARSESWERLFGKFTRRHFTTMGRHTIVLYLRVTTSPARN